jgi:hypothetical protein
MFDRSEKAGVAGNMQWGLDTGMHEDGWNPDIPPAPEIEGQLREGNDRYVMHLLSSSSLIEQ